MPETMIETSDRSNRGFGRGDLGEAPRRWMGRAALAALLAATCAVGCGKKQPEPLKVGASVDATDQLIVIKVDCPAQATPTLTGIDPKLANLRGSGMFRKFYVDGTKLPAGEQRVTITCTLKEKGQTRVGKATVTFKRAPLLPKITCRLVKKTGPGAVSIITNAPLGCKGDLTASTETGKAELSFSAPPGTKITLGDQRWESKAGATTWATSLQVLAPLWDLPASRIGISWGTKVPLSATSPEGGTQKAELSLSVDPAYLLYGLGLPNGGQRSVPVLAPGESPTGKPQALLRLIGYKQKVLGKAKRVRDIQLVAFVRDLGTRKKSCGVYRGGKSGRSQLIENIARDTQVRVYDRRTGKLVREKTFKVKMPACPRTLSSKFTGLRAEPSQKEIERWLLSFVKP